MFEKERMRQGETEQEGGRDEDDEGGLDKGKRDGFKNRNNRQPEDEALRLVPQDPETGEIRSWYVLASGGVRSSDSAGRSTSEGEKLESGHDSNARKEVEGVVEDAQYTCNQCCRPDDVERMIWCENSDHPWYHLSCVGLSIASEDGEDWQCPVCTASTSIQFEKRKRSAKPTIIDSIFSDISEEQ